MFMDLPQGFEENFGENKSCQLKKTLYGLKNLLVPSLASLKRSSGFKDMYKVKPIIQCSTNTQVKGEW